MANRRRKPPPPSLAAQRIASERAALLQRIDAELTLLSGRMFDGRAREDRILIKAEIHHLRTIKSELLAGKRRKPPESGLPVPAVPPRGPLPKLGGAEAPFDFDTQ